MYLISKHSQIKMRVLMNQWHKILKIYQNQVNLSNLFSLWIGFIFLASLQIFFYTQKMLGCFNPNLGQIWTNPNAGLKCN